MRLDWAVCHPRAVEHPRGWCWSAVVDVDPCPLYPTGTRIDVPGHFSDAGSARAAAVAHLDRL